MARTESQNADRNEQFLLTEQIASSIREIWRMARGMTKSSSKEKVSIEQFWILRLVYDHGPQRIKDIAEELGTTSSPVTISVKRLERAQLLRRERSKEDERVVTVHLTEKGKKTFESWRNERWKALSSFFDSLTEAEKHQLSDLLEKVLSRTKSERSNFGSHTKLGHTNPRTSNNQMG